MTYPPDPDPDDRKNPFSRAARSSLRRARETSSAPTPTRPMEPAEDEPGLLSKAIGAAQAGGRAVARGAGYVRDKVREDILDEGQDPGGFEARAERVVQKALPDKVRAGLQVFAGGGIPKGFGGEEYRDEAIMEATEAGIEPWKTGALDVLGMFTRDAALGVGAHFAAHPLASAIGSRVIGAAGERALSNPGSVEYAKHSLRLMPEFAAFGGAHEAMESGEVSGKTLEHAAMGASLAPVFGQLGAARAGRKGFPDIAGNPEMEALVTKKLSEGARIVDRGDGVAVWRYPDGSEVGIDPRLYEGKLEGLPDRGLHEDIPGLSEAQRSAAESTRQSRLPIKAEPEPTNRLNLRFGPTEGAPARGQKSLPRGRSVESAEATGEVRGPRGEVFETVEGTVEGGRVMGARQTAEPRTPSPGDELPSAREVGTRIAEEISEGGFEGRAKHVRPKKRSDNEIPYLAEREARAEGQIEVASGSAPGDRRAARKTRYSETNQREGNPEVVEAANQYNRKRNLNREVRQEDFEYDPVEHQEIAEAYEAMPKEDPRAAASYEAFAKETADQFRYLTDELGIEVEFTAKDPYANSAEMMADVRENGRLKVFSGGEPPNNILGELHPETGQSYNNMFRAVHDFFGHSGHGNSFGKVGEEAAWRAHSKMFSGKAQPAMTTETRGQNAWFNWSQGNRGKPITERSFADQKLALLPEKFWPQEARALSSARKPMKLEHFSDKPRDVIDPRFQGSGRSGAERARLDDPNKTKVSYYYANEHPPEIQMGPFRHTVEGDLALYDLQADPLGILPAAEQRVRETGASSLGTVVENMAKREGYDGLINAGRENYVSVFRELKPSSVERVNTQKLRAQRTGRADKGVLGDQRGYFEPGELRREVVEGAERVGGEAAAKGESGAHRRKQTLSAEDANLVNRHAGREVLDEGTASIVRDFLPPKKRAKFDESLDLLRRYENERGYFEPGELRREVHEPSRRAGQEAARLAEEAKQEAAKVDQAVADGASGRKARASTPNQKAAANLGQAARNRGLGNPVAGWLRENISRVSTWATKHLGESGKKWADQAGAVLDRALQKKGKEFELWRQATRKLSREQREEITRLVNKHGYKAEQHAPPELAQVIRRLRTVRDEMGLRQYQELGGKREGRAAAGSGRFIPQIPNKLGRQVIDKAVEKGLSDPKVSAAADKIAASRGVTREEALVMIRNLAERRLQRDHGYYTQERTPLPDEYVELDFLAYMEDFLEKDHLFLEGTREWGQGHEGARAIFEEIATQDRGAAKLLEGHHKVSFGTETPESVGSSKVWGAISNILTTTKLNNPLLTLQQIGQRFINTGDMPLSVVWQTTRDLPPVISRLRKASRIKARQIRKSGAVQAKATAKMDISQGAPLENMPTKTLRAIGFLQGEEGNQIFTALAAKRAVSHWLAREASRPDSRIGRIAEGIREVSIFPGKKYSRSLEKLVGDEARMERLAEAWRNGERLPKEDIQAVMIKANRDRNFALDLISKPVKWDQRGGFRVLGKFKPFPMKQTMHMLKHVYKEAALGNMAPLLKTIPMAMFMAEIYNLPRDLILGRQGAITTKLVKDPDSLDELDEVIAQIVTHQGDAATMGMFGDMLWGWDQMLMGVGYSSTRNLFEAGAQALMRTDKKGTLKQAQVAGYDFLEKEIPAVRYASNLAKASADALSEHNDHLTHRRIRAAAFDYAAEQKVRGPGDTVRGMATDIAWGRRGFQPSENTLFYEYAADAIALGATETASEYMADIMGSGSTREERNQLASNMVQSIRRSAPLGPISWAEDWESHPKIIEYLDSLSPKARREAIQSQRSYLSKANAAMRRAVASVKGGD